MAAASSTSCGVEKRCCSRSRSSGVTFAGVAVMASAISSTSFSSGEKRSLSAYQFRLRIWSSLRPACLPPAELMSIQKGHSTSLAARICPRTFSLAGTRLVFSSAMLNLA